MAAPVVCQRPPMIYRSIFTDHGLGNLCQILRQVGIETRIRERYPDFPELAAFQLKNHILLSVNTFSNKAYKNAVEL
jgi:hypothetical protein